MKSLIQGILKIDKIINRQSECSPMFIFTFISSSAASNCLCLEVKYRGKALNCCLLSDLVKRLKLESRATNFRDETMYRESDKDRRVIVILTPNKNVRSAFEILETPIRFVSNSLADPSGPENDGIWFVRRYVTSACGMSHT